MFKKCANLPWWIVTLFRKMCLNLKGWILNIAQCLCRLIYLCVSKLVPTFLGELWTCFTKCALSLKGEFWTLKHVNLSGSIRILISDEKLWCSWGDRAASSLKADMWQADSHQKVCLGVGVNGVRYFHFGVGTVGFGTAQTQHILTLGYFTHIHKKMEYYSDYEQGKVGCTKVAQRA